MATQGVLVEYDYKNEIYTNSGLLFGDNYVIITGNILMPYLQELGVHQWLNRLQPGVLNFDLFSSDSKPRLKLVTKEQTSSNVETSEDKFKFKQAEVLAGFICTNIFESSRQYLRDWAVDFEDKEYQVKEILALFFILKCSDQNNNDVGDLNGALVELLEGARKFQLTVGRAVYVEGTPLGNRIFVNSYSQGVVSNVTGASGCFLLSDCPTAPGSEGSPVFVKTEYTRRFAVGIVISCLNWWKGEWVGLTLAANLVPLLSQIVSLNVMKVAEGTIVSDKEINATRGLLSNSIRSLVQIVSGSGWGTGILLDKSKGIFVTNSHVIESQTSTVIHWKNQQIKAAIVYSTPNSEVYDLAILKVNASFIKKLAIPQVEVSLKPAEIGEEVFAIGFPLFSRDLRPKPTLTRGHVSQAHSSMIKTTCCVLPGSSGGGIFRPNGQLIAIIVSNTRMEDVGVVYPRLNMAIPILAVYHVIEQFLQNGDIEVLKKLKSEDITLCKQWNYFRGKL